MTTWVDDFTVDHFADGTYTLYGGTGPPTVGGGHAIFDTVTEWFDRRAVASVAELGMTVLADTQMYLVAMGLASPDGAQGVVVQIIAVSNTWEIAVGRNLGAPEATTSGSFTVPSGNWALSLLVTENAIHASDGLGQTLDLELTTDLAAILTEGGNLSPFGVAASAALLGVAGAVVDLSQWTYTIGGATPTPGSTTPGSILSAGVSVGVVR